MVGCQLRVDFGTLTITTSWFPNINILAEVSLDVEHTAPSSIFFPKCNLYTNISILAAVSQGVEHTAPSLIFPDKIDCLKFITMSKATKENEFIWPVCWRVLLTSSLIFISHDAKDFNRWLCQGYLVISSMFLPHPAYWVYGYSDIAIIKMLRIKFNIIIIIILVCLQIHGRI